MYQFVSSGTGRGGDVAIVDCDNWNMYSEQDRKVLGSESMLGITISVTMMLKLMTSRMMRGGGPLWIVTT